MRILNIVLTTLLLCSFGVMSLSCASKSDSASESQVVTVQRGDLTIDITASGNLALSVIEDLAFEISGTVEEILVEEGDSVAEGQVLVKLDTSEWEDELESLEDQVTAAERQVLAKERNLLQAEINLENAELTLEDAEEETLTTITGDIFIASTDARQIDILELRVELDEANLEDAKEDLEDAKEAVTDAEEELEEALEKSPEVIAPFDGFITKVRVEGGDEVLTGTVAVQLADPEKFEADILVSEMDILQVKLGGEAYVQVDAMQGLSLPAEVTHISPTATIQQGVVNYQVKVELQSLEAIIQESQQATQEAMEEIGQGKLPERLKQAIEEGQITQEQAEEMMKQMQQGMREQQRQVPSAISEDFQLREGLTVTVSIIVDERNDVLLVPNGAITTQGQQTYIQVLSPDGTIEERVVTIGISNWQYTEVTEGLSEDEQVVIPQGTTTTTTTPQQQGPSGGMFIPGMGRPR